MKIITNYDKFLLESFEFDGNTFSLSKELKRKLWKIKNPISSSLLHDNVDYTKSAGVIVDCSDNDNQFTIRKGASTPYNIRIGRFISKLYKDKFDSSEIETFINQYKSRMFNETSDSFKLVNGRDILLNYNDEIYSTKFGTNNTIFSSTMNNQTKELGFFARNEDVSLLILKDETGLLGRALVWKISEVNGDKENRYFMDRIYCVNDSIVNIFIKYAEESDYLYREKQSVHNRKIVDPLTNEIGNISLKTPSTFINRNNIFPYVDTMLYFNVNGGFLTNDLDVAESEDGEIIVINENN